jgi:hypothetical protein
VGRLEVLGSIQRGGELKVEADACAGGAPDCGLLGNCRLVASTMTKPIYEAPHSCRSDISAIVESLFGQ